MIPAAAQQDAQGFYSWVLTADNTVTMRRLRPPVSRAAVRGGRWSASGGARSDGRRAAPA
jgi:hypothetical protein